MIHKHKKKYNKVIYFNILLSLIFISMNILSMHTCFATSLWQIDGYSQKYGKYNGKLELSKNIQNEIVAVRIINYLNSSFFNKKIQEVWIGRASLENGKLNLSFNLKNANFISKFANISRDKDRSNNNVIVDYNMSYSKNSTSSYDIKVEDNVYNDHYSALNDTSFNLINNTSTIYNFKNTQSKMHAIHPKMSPVTGFFLKKILLKSYYNTDIIKRNQNNSLYKAGISYILYDKRDKIFYQSNPDTIRITNSTNDKISQLENYMRSQAFSFSKQEKEKIFFDSLLKYNLNNANMITYGIRNLGQSISYSNDGDALLWNAYLLQTLLMKYHYTQDSKILDLAMKVLQAQFNCIDITGNPKTFARVISKSQNNMVWHQGKGKFKNYYWLGSGNNDMGLGFLYSMFAVLNTPANIDLTARKNAIIYLQKYQKTDMYKKYISHRFITLGLLNAYAPKHKEKNFYKGKFLPSFNPQLSQFFRLSNDLLISYDYEIGLPIYAQGVSDWSGNQLSLITRIMIIEMTKKMLTNPALTRSMKYKLKKRLNKYQYTFRNQMKKLDDARSFLTTITSRYYSKKFFKKEDQAIFKDALNRLDEFPVLNRSLLVFNIDHSINENWAPGVFPVRPWKLLQHPTDSQLKNGIQSNIIYPLFETSTLENDNFIFKGNPFSHPIHFNSSIVSARLSFLYAYWMLKDVERIKRF